MGYHRLFSHKSFTAGPFLKVLLVLSGSMALQGPVRWWVVRHRLHHRFPETEDDPYAVSRGLWYSHMGWLFERRAYPKMKLVDMDDMDDDPVVAWQQANYPLIAISLGFILPTALGLLWGDAIGSLLYVGFLSKVAVWHVTWFINSLAHYVGEAPFTSEGTARGHFYALAILTHGEAYHNFHHEFPTDYRNGIAAWDWDPTKWLIWISARLGLASNLTTTPDAEVDEARAYVKAYHLTSDKFAKTATGFPTKTAFHSANHSALPSMTTTPPLDESRHLVVISGYVLDITGYVDKHPGGRKWLERFRGRDATKAFMGGLNMHTRHARRLAEGMIVGKVDGGVGFQSEDVPGGTYAEKRGAAATKEE